MSNIVSENNVVAIEQHEGGYIIRPKVHKIQDQLIIDQMGAAMFQLVDNAGGEKFDVVFDFANMQFLSSAALTKFLTMDRKLKARNGQESELHLAQIPAHIFETFKITQLDKLFDASVSDKERGIEGKPAEQMLAEAAAARGAGLGR